jgi:hypothetical protein
MAAPGPSFDVVGALTFREVRRFVRRAHALPFAMFIGVVYALASMLQGGMLSFFPVRGGTTVEILTGTATGQGWWNYPGLLVVAPWGVLALPFFPTLAMVLVAAGVGLGMAVAAVLIYRLLRPSPRDAALSKAVGAATGLTPAMISLVTLGSCCTTTAAATGGIGLIAQASGTTTANLLLNNWYLGVAQIGIVWSALIAQELLLSVYGGLLGLGPSGRAPVRVIAPPIGRRWAMGAALRATLAVGGILWSLSMLAEWTTHDPTTAGAGWWFRWVVQHQLVAGIAIGAAFFPGEALRVARWMRTGYGRVVGGGVAVAAVSLLVWLPPPFPAWGLDSFGSQVAGALGIPVAWGAIPLGSVTGVPLAVRWGLEYVVPAGFALASVLTPDRIFAPLLATVARVEPSSEAGLVVAPHREAEAGGGARPSPSSVGLVPAGTGAPEGR